MTDSYVAVPVASVLPEWVAASTSGTLDAARVTPDGRVVLRFRGEVPESLAVRRYTTRDRAGILAWLPQTDRADETSAAQAEAHRAEIRARWGV